MVTDTKKKLEELLLKSNVSKEQIYEAKEESKKTKKPIEQVLKEKKILSDRDYSKIKAEILGISFIDLSSITIPPNVLQHIPEDVAKKYHIVAFDINKETKALKIATTQPEEYTTIEFIQKRIGTEIEPYMATNADITKTLDQYSGIQTEVEKEIEADKILPENVKELEKITAIDAIKHDSPIAKLIDTILEHAVIGGASDVHIEPSTKTLDVRYRVDGILRKSVTLPLTITRAVVSRIKILSNLKIDEQRLPQDGRFHGTYGDREIDFRVSTMPTVNGEKAVMRILDKTTGILTLEQLGFVGKSYEILQINIHKPHGMTLVTGPTGAGKSTTLYAVIGVLNNVGLNIVTLEDPVEYFIDGINQSQVNHQIGFTFASGLRSIVRQDPDVIMVGEIRDKETADMAVHAALTGHIVLSTLHTNDAAGATPRLIDMGIEPFLIASSVNVVIAQRLARRICQHCKTELKVPKEVILEIEKEIKNLPKEVAQKIKGDSASLTIYKGVGCDFCNQTGYKGRIGIFEVLPIEGKVEDLVMNRASSSDIQKASIEMGIATMKQDGVLKVLEGFITMEELWRITSE